MQYRQIRQNGCNGLRRGLVTCLVIAAGLVPATPASAAQTFEERMLELVNGARAARGVGPVRALPALAAIAADAPYGGCGYLVSGRSTDMGLRNYFSHGIKDCGNKAVSDMVQAARISHSGLAENIVWVGGLTDPAVAADRLYNELMASAAHRDNILNPVYTHVGVGSWHTAAGATWSGGGTALRNVYIATQVFVRDPVLPPPSGARFHPLTPSRILDTRVGSAPLGAGATMDLQVTGRGGVPATGVSAVVVNVSVTNPTAPSYLTAFPAGEAMPNASNLNYAAGQTVPNLVTAKLGAGGRLSLFNAAGTTDVIADVAGWYDAGTLSTGSRYHPVTPSRILDTRIGATQVGAGRTMDLQVTGRGGVPAGGVRAVVLNVSVTNPTATSYLTAFPAGGAVPTTSNLNFVAGESVANLVTAKLGGGGRLSLFNAAGATDVIADVAGWYDDGTAAGGSTFHPLTPGRILDTRYWAGPVGAGSTTDLQVTGRAGVPASGVSAVVVNVAVTAPTAAGYLTVFPAGETMPTASNLNYVAGETVSNLVAAKLGAGGRFSLFNAAGRTHLLADVAGWFSAG